MTRKGWWWSGGAAVLTAALLVWAFAPRPVEVEVATAAEGRFETTIDEDGKTRLHDRYVVSTPLAGVLERIRLREGDAVAAGAVVATLTPGLSPLLDERTQRELRARIERTKAQVRRADTRIDRGRIALLQARSELQRTEALARQGFLSPTRLEHDQLALEAAQKELDTAQQERQVALHEALQAEAALSAVRATAGEAVPFELRSPVAGRVLRVLQPNEGAVAIGTPLLEIGDTTRLEVVAELLTTDALKLSPGAKVRIERWGGPGLLDGRVRLIEPGAFTKVSALGVEEQRVRVLIAITSPPAAWQALGDGYRVGVSVIALEQANALQVPVSAVFPLPGAAAGMAAFVVRDGRARLQPVQAAARNGRQAWITQGLKAGDVVIVYPGTAVADGTRVRPRRV